LGRQVGMSPSFPPTRPAIWPRQAHIQAKRKGAYPASGNPVIPTAGVLNRPARSGSSTTGPFPRVPRMARPILCSQGGPGQPEKRPLRRGAVLRGQRRGTVPEAARSTHAPEPRTNRRRSKRKWLRGLTRVGVGATVRPARGQGLVPGGSPLPAGRLHQAGQDFPPAKDGTSKGLTRRGSVSNSELKVPARAQETFGDRSDRDVTPRKTDTFVHTSPGWPGLDGGRRYGGTWNHIPHWSVKSRHESRQGSQPEE